MNLSSPLRQKDLLSKRCDSMPPSPLTSVGRNREGTRGRRASLWNPCRLRHRPSPCVCVPPSLCAAASRPLPPPPLPRRPLPRRGISRRRDSPGRRPSRQQHPQPHPTRRRRRIRRPAGEPGGSGGPGGACSLMSSLPLLPAPLPVSLLAGFRGFPGFRGLPIPPSAGPVPPPAPRAAGSR